MAASPASAARGRRRSSAAINSWSFRVRSTLLTAMTGVRLAWPLAARHSRPRRKRHIASTRCRQGSAPWLKSRPNGRTDIAWEARRLYPAKLPGLNAYGNQMNPRPLQSMWARSAFESTREHGLVRCSACRNPAVIPSVRDRSGQKSSGVCTGNRSGRAGELRPRPGRVRRHREPKEPRLLLVRSALRQVLRAHVLLVNPWTPSITLFRFRLWERCP